MKTYLKALTILFIICTTFMAKDAKGETRDFYKTFYIPTLAYTDYCLDTNGRCCIVYDGLDCVIAKVPINRRYLTSTEEVGTNIRVFPNIESESAYILKPGETIVSLGNFNGWEIILNCGEKFYMWCEYSKEVEATDDIIEFSYNEHIPDSWIPLGLCRISSYCYECNTPRYSYKSGVSGWSCQEWETCAMNGIAKGTKVYIEGYGYFVVNDSGPSHMNGKKWADIFVMPDECHIWDKKDIYIVKEKK